MPESKPVIQDLIAKARAGDTAAQGELFSRCRNYLNVVARTQVESWMRTRVDASDLVQQTLLEAHQAFAQFTGSSEAEWLGWLKQVLSHNTQDYIRRQRAAKRGGGRDLPLDAESRVGLGPLQADLPTPSQMLIAHERELALADCLSRLTPDHQEVLQLRSLQRLPFDEVAQRMGRTRPAVQMLWMRAIQKLELLLNDGNDCP